jgi:hypothetical protein
MQKQAASSITEPEKKIKEIRRKRKEEETGGDKYSSNVKS